MKLRNKKTGEIKEVQPITIGGFRSLAELNEEWEDMPEEEDYEEPEEYWYIDPMVCGVYCTKIKKDEDLYDFNKEIGNCFDTREEAEKAVEKLKAWKRLKDVGFRFIDWELDMKTVADGKIWFDIGVNTEWDAERLLELKPEAKESLDILFGCEE